MQTSTSDAPTVNFCWNNAHSWATFYIPNAPPLIIKECNCGSMANVERRKGMVMKKKKMERRQ